MKARQIDKELCKVIDALSEAHPPIKQELRKNSIVTGGAIASMLLKEKVHDYDVYFDSLEALVKVMSYFGAQSNAKYLVAFQAGASIPQEGVYQHPEEEEELADVPEDTPDVHYKLFTDIGSLARNPDVLYISLYYQSVGSWVLGDAQKKTAEKEDKKFFLKFASPNAITLSDKVQLVFRFFGPPEEIHRNYDFVHATNYWTYKDGLVTNTEALEAILARELIYKGSRFPLASIFRTRKFIQRNWTIHIANYVKMAFQLNMLDLTNIHVLREQLTGVDAAYLNAIIRECAKAPHSITCEYVCNLVDRIIKGGEEEREDEDDET